MYWTKIKSKKICKLNYQGINVEAYKVVMCEWHGDDSGNRDTEKVQEINMLVFNEWKRKWDGHAIKDKLLMSDCDHMSSSTFT